MEINNIEEYLNKKKEEYNNKFNYMLIDPEFTKSEYQNRGQIKKSN